MKWPKHDQDPGIALPNEIEPYQQDRHDQDPVGLIQALDRYGYHVVSMRAEPRFEPIEAIEPTTIELSISNTHRRSYDAVEPLQAATPMTTNLHYQNPASEQQPSGLGRIADDMEGPSDLTMFKPPQADVGVAFPSFGNQVDNVVTPRAAAEFEDLGDQHLRAVSMRLAPADLDNAAELVRRHGTNRTYEVRRALRDARWLDDEVQAGATVWVEHDGKRREVRLRD